VALEELAEVELGLGGVELLHSGIRREPVAEEALEELVGVLPIQLLGRHLCELGRSRGGWRLGARLWLSRRHLCELGRCRHLHGELPGHGRIHPARDFCIHGSHVGCECLLSRLATESSGKKRYE
jgi:hypothetical protein